MNSRKIFLFCFFTSLILYGCAKPPEFISFSTVLNKKINNLTDINNDKMSDLFFWNTSTMSKSEKFLEPCFFELADIKNNKYLKYKLGEVSDIPFTAYLNDDSIADFGIFRSYSDGGSEWFIRNGANFNDGFNLRFGRAGDIPVPTDFDGDGKSDIAIYRPVDGTFEGVLSKSNSPFQLNFESRGAIPVPKDYDGDGAADPAVYNHFSGTWKIKPSSSSNFTEIKLGGPYFLPVPSDYDGDGKADLCVWNTVTNEIKVLLTTFSRLLPQDIADKIQKQLHGKELFPVPLDYDGDGASEMAFWDSSLKLLITFDIKKDYKKKIYHLTEISNSIPVNNFILNVLKTANLKQNQKPLFAGFKNGKLFAYSLRENSKNDGLRLVSDNSLQFNWNIRDNVEPFISDFDGDYILDSCLWSDETGVFLCNSSRAKLKFALQLGQPLDIPFIGDFNYDNITDIGVYRQATGTFRIRYLGKVAPREVKEIKIATDAGLKAVPQVNDYDGDGIDDCAVYNPDEQTYLIRNSFDSRETKINICDNQCGKDTIPVNGDFDGDGKADPAVITDSQTHNMKKFVFYSSNEDKLIVNLINNNMPGVPLISDLDYDLKSDLVFLNSNSGILGVCKSSTGWNYNEQKVANERIEKVKLVNHPSHI